VRQGIVETEVDRDGSRVRPRGCAEGILDLGFTTADDDQLAARRQQIRKRTENEIHPLLRGEPADHGEQRCLAPERKAEFGLQPESSACSLSLQTLLPRSLSAV